MKKYVKCKVCGFIMEEDELKDVCPACGVPKSAFIEFKDIVSSKRRRILNLHIHPISVHFSESIAVLSIPLFIIALITSGALNNYILFTLKTLSVLLPFSVVLAFLTGIYDGKVRFKKLSPPYLKLKIYIGTILLLSSIITPFLLFSTLTTLIKVLLFILLILNLLCSSILGKLGGRLIDSVMPGK